MERVMRREMRPADEISPIDLPLTLTPPPSHLATRPDASFDHAIGWLQSEHTRTHARTHAHMRSSKLVCASDGNRSTGS
jgi:hypothetical protein